MRCPATVAAVFLALSCLVAAPAQEIWVSGFLSQEVHRYAFSDGTYLGPLVQVAGPQGITHGPDGSVFVVAEGENRILHLDGQTLAVLGDLVVDDPLTPEDETGGLDGPTGAVFGADGSLYVGSFNTDAILRYDGTGAFLGQFVVPGDGGLDGPDAGMTFGPDGHLYVPSFFSHEVLRYDGATGAFLDAFVTAGDGGLANPRTVVFRTDGSVLVSSEGTSALLGYDAQGSFVGAFVVDYRQPTGFAISPLDGNLYATSVDRNNVRRFDGDTGERIGAAVNEGDGGLDGAVFLAFWPDPYLHLGRLQPGQAGGVNTLDVRNGTPGSLVFLLVGFTPASLAFPFCPHARLGIASPFLLRLPVDAAGEIHVAADLDPALAGVTVLFQTVELTSCRISNLVVQTLR